MRKAKITACLTETVGFDFTNAAIGVGWKVGKYERYRSVVFPIANMAEKLDRTINEKSDLLIKYLMKYVRQECDRWNEGDADITVLENIMRLKIPFLIRKAVNREYFVQRFE